MRLLHTVLSVSTALAAATPPTAPLLTRQSASRPSSYDPHTIDMPIDHFRTSDRYLPHTDATFQQRYFFDNTYYKPGGPVFLYIGGETSGESRFSNLRTGIIQILMNATNGLGVILENRYYGESYPFNTSTTDELRFLTTEQTIADNAYFAQYATFPGVAGNLSAPGTPWILYGGSLAGAQTAFSLVQYQGLLWGGIASSAVVHTVPSYPEWYNSIQKFGPSDCIANINNIVDKMDSLIFSNNTAALQQLKSIFGLGTLTDHRDFANTIAFPIGNVGSYPTNTWQELNWYANYSAPDFYYFCNNITDPNTPSNIIAIDTLLSNYTNNEPWTGLGAYANYIQNALVSACPSPDLLNSTSCYGTQNQSYWADTTNSDSRSYTYSTCTEQGAYEAAYPYLGPQSLHSSSPGYKPSLISRIIQPSYQAEWCTWSFPRGLTNSIPTSPNLTTYTRYGDLNISAPRLAFIDGAADVWLDLCYHSKSAPLRYGAEQYLIAGGGHHWDSYGILDLDAEPGYIRQAHLWEIRMVNGWLVEFNSTRAAMERMRGRGEL